MIINLNHFGFLQFMSKAIAVESLEMGARMFGGATKLKDKIISNIADDNNVLIPNDNENSLSIFVPSTTNVDKRIDNREYVANVVEDIYTMYGENADVTITNTTGSWYNDENDTIVYEDVSIVSLHLDKPYTIDDVWYFKYLGNEIKEQMKQSCVSVSINNTLCLV